MASELRVDKIVPVDGVPTGGGGGIIQVQSTTLSTPFTSTSTSYADITGLSVSITPKFSTSKILCFGHISGNGTNNTRALYRLLRTVSGGSDVIIATPGNATGYQYTGNGKRIEYPHFVLDTPNTTNSKEFIDSEHRQHSHHAQREIDTTVVSRVPVVCVCVSCECWRSFCGVCVCVCVLAVGASYQ